MITCSMPGRHGDLLWSLPTCRAIAEATPEGQVDLVISPAYGSIAPLLAHQPYLRSVIVDPAWHVQETAPMTPREAPSYPDAIHLGYDGWPSPTLPEDIYQRAQAMLGIALPPLDLTRPWITADPWPDVPHRLIAGFSDEHFELKCGVLGLVALNWTGPSLVTACALAAPGSRWVTEAQMRPVGWIESARRIVTAEVFLGCCSALHVLAIACGIPAVIMEPNPQRHHPVFWPLGMDGPRVQIVRGGDGQPTFDARHVAEAVRARLEGR